MYLFFLVDEIISNAITIQMRCTSKYKQQQENEESLQKPLVRSAFGQAIYIYHYTQFAY